MSALVVALAMGLLILLDPRTQEYWGGRVGDLMAWPGSARSSDGKAQTPPKALGRGRRGGGVRGSFRELS